MVILIKTHLWGGVVQICLLVCFKLIAVSRFFHDFMPIPDLKQILKKTVITLN